MSSLYYIKERHNPQFKHPYYSACGKLSKKRAKEIEDGSLYGSNVMRPYETEEAYEQALQKLREQGFYVYEY